MKRSVWPLVTVCVGGGSILLSSVDCDASPEDVGRLQRALARLEEERTTAALTELLRSNEETKIDVVRLKGQSSSDFTIATVGGERFTIVVAIINTGVTVQLGAKTCEVGLVFNKEGRLVGRFGGGVGDDGANGDSVRCLNFGTAEHWFLWVHRGGSRKEFKEFVVRSDIYLIGDEFRRPLRLYHHPNSIAYTSTRDQARDEGAFLWIMREPLDPSTDDREGGRLLIRWSVQKSCFLGAAEAVHKGQSVYRVDIKKSDGFEPR